MRSFVFKLFCFVFNTSLVSALKSQILASYLTLVAETFRLTVEVEDGDRGINDIADTDIRLLNWTR
jgi:hypothetical protein